jgi:hypothetical protein
MVSDPFLVGVFFGFVPSMGLLYVLLKNYEGLFNDKRAFFAYLLGLGAGLVATMLQIFFGPSGREDPATGTVQVALFGLVHVLLFAMILNSKRFRGKRDTPFYGVAVGLGFGAINVLFLIGNAVQELAKTPGSIWLETFALTYIGLYFIGSILLHAAVAAYVARGAATRSLGAPMFQGAVAEGLYLGGFYLLFLDPIGTLVPLLGLALTIALIGRVLKKVLDPIVPPEIRREIEIHQRRLARQTIRESTESNGSDPDEAQTPAAAPEERPRSGPGSP